MEPRARLAPAAEWIARRFEADARAFALDGLGASGKSSLAALVAERVPAAHVVTLDDFTRPGAVGWERERFVEQVWTPWRQGLPARYQRHHWTQAEPGEWTEVPAGAKLLVEGIGASEPPEGVVWDVLVWLAASPAVRTARAQRRDPGRFGCWNQTWRPIEDAWFADQRPWRGADLCWVNA